ncbi:hypothetical protein NBRC116188_19460 [Oceaniserpentilla sp. 4NH20-0058]|uniref:energy transducer TonB n=1 Tax=Oceaniserpentilla sp. 4NH20-0058 TaxID=3127660 RepID=UPI003104527F
MQPAFRLTFLLSLLVHVLVFLPWLFSEQPAAPVAKDKTVEVILQPEAPQANPINNTPKPSLDVPPPPMHLEDDITKANNTNGKVEEQAQEKTQIADIEHTDKTAQPTLETPEQTETSTPEPPAAPPVVHSNSPMLSQYLKANPHKNQGTESKASKEEEEKARWYNEVLKRISEQINYIWVKPRGVNPFYRGTIRLTINSNGFLEQAWVHIPSGSAQLDRSALRAINQVYRYDIPQAQKITQYYQSLEFHYSGQN